MRDRRQSQGGQDAEFGWDRLEPFLAVEIDILTGINHIESRDPKGYHTQKYPGWYISCGVNNELRIAAQAPTGARPSVNPKIKCDIQVKRFVNEYPIKKRYAPGNRINVNGLSCQAANARIIPAKTVPIQAVRGEIEPLINGRCAVRGLRASI